MRDAMFCPHFHRYCSLTRRCRLSTRAEGVLVELSGKMRLCGLREVGRFLSSDHEGILIGSHIRRLTWRIVTALLLCSAALFASHGVAWAEDRTLSFHHIHTNEDITITYKRGGQFDPEALQKLNYFMRDWRKNTTIKMDPALFDLIWEMYRELGSKQPINVICGHRTGSTNEMLRHTVGGQAKGSKHITGQAIDLQFPDVNIKQLRNSALIRERGGVGYYPTSSMPFVHVDTGNVRAWPRVPRMELALLFPGGNTKHIPADGKPLTKGDFRVAMAQLQERGGELPIAARARLNGNSASTLLAGLAGAKSTSPSATPAISASPVQLAAASEPAKPKPAVVMASFAPIPRLGIEPAAPKPASLTQPVISAGAQQTSARASDVDGLTDDILKGPREPQLREEAVDQQADYDDDHPDEEAYQPFPVLPFMSDTPVASMDLTDSQGQTEFSLAKVHVYFGERREMFDTRFDKGLQFAELFWAQRFRGTAVNTALRRLQRDEVPVRTAQQTAR
jgi:uncharacterized protein YcbK (DUF882 family)